METQDVILVKGCYNEAYRADFVWIKLEKLRVFSSEENNKMLDCTITEIRQMASLLRELGDYALVHRDRLPLVLDRLNLLLPSLCKSLVDIKKYCDKGMRQERWNTIIDKLQYEMDHGVSFIFWLYAQVLSQLILILKR